MENTLVTKFVIDDKTLYIKTIWKPNANDLFHITIYEDDKTWFGQYASKSTEEHRERCDETEDQYYNNVKKALSKDHDFTYSFTTKTKDSAEFRWKKKYEDDVLLHGCVLVHQDNHHHQDTPTSKNALIDVLLAENQDLKESINRLSAKNTDLNHDIDKYRNELNNFMEMKTSLETSLYGKFVQVLSAKKRRIQLLEDNINTISKFCSD